MFSAAFYSGRNNKDQNKMPGGVGPVSAAIISACSCTDRAIASAKNTNEIFYNLDSRRAFYDSTESFLYFVNSPTGTLAETISAALRGLNSTATIEQVYLDPHKCFNGARRVRLDEAQADAMLVALRLAGVRATVR